MRLRAEPEFLTREIVDLIHQHQIEKYGGAHGLRDGNALESAIAAARNIYYYGDGDLFTIAAAYAFHIAESQAYLDGNKRTGSQAAILLEGCGIDTALLPELPSYEAMIQIANHELDRTGLAAFFRQTLNPRP